MKRIVKWLIGILLVGSIGAYWVYEEKKPLKLELIEVQASEVIQSFKEEGTVQSALQREVYSLATQKISDVFVEEGDYIEEGSILLNLDTDSVVKQMDVLRAQRNNLVQLKNMTLKELSSQIEHQQVLIQETSRQIETAQKDLERLESLYKNQSVSSTEVETMENRVELLESTREQQQLVLEQLQWQYDNPDSETVQYHNSNLKPIDAQLVQLNKQLEDSVIKAPISGVVVHLNYKEGGIINPQLPICTLYDPESYHIEVMVLTEDAVSLTKGTAVDLTQKLANGELRFQGAISYIAPAATESMSSLGLKEQRVKMNIEITELNQALLYPGYSVDVTFITYRQDNLIAIPKNTVFRVNGEDTVWVVQDGIAALRHVQKGMSTDLDYVIEKGLDMGEKIIKNPNADDLVEGKAIQEIVR